MKKLIALVFSLALITSSNAALIVSQIGDIDGFGIGVNADESFSYSSVISDGDNTDIWIYGANSFNFVYSAPVLGDIVSASLEIFTGGQGHNGLTQVLLDGQSVGTLTDGDDSGNYARLDVIDLASFFSLLDGTNQLDINTALSGDGWVLDYAKLTIETADNNTSPNDVPEPAPLALLALGLLAAGLKRNRKA